MFNINELYDGDQLLEGRYRLLKRLSVDGALGLAVDTAGVANYLSNGEHNYAIDESSCPQVVIRFNLPKNTSDIKDERLSDDECKEGQEYYHLNQSQPVYSSTYNSFSGEKVSYDVFSFSTKVSLKPPFPRKPLYITLVVICLLLLCGGVYLIMHKPVPAPPEPPETPLLPTIERAEELLRCGSFDDGINMLDTLMKMHDYRAAFIMSRLLYLPQNGDTLYEKWDSIGKKPGIRDSICKICKKYDINGNKINEKSHKLLYKAFDWCHDAYKEDDWIMLFLLGCDYKAGKDFYHGCEQNTDYACWCFKKADAILETMENTEKIRDHIKEELGNLDCDTPQRPSESITND